MSSIKGRSVDEILLSKLWSDGIRSSLIALISLLIVCSALRSYFTLERDVLMRPFVLSTLLCILMSLLIVGWSGFVWKY